MVDKVRRAGSCLCGFVKDKGCYYEIGDALPCYDYAVV